MKPPSHRLAVLQALLVTFLWSTSWVLIKIGLQSVPALTFSGLRYVLAAVCLLPFILNRAGRTSLARLTRRDWLNLGLLGILFIAFTQGSQYIGLVYLPTVTVSLMLNFTAPLVAFLGIVFLKERPTWLQWMGVVLFMVGVIIYFYPAGITPGQWGGAAVVAAGVIGNALSSILGRGINRRGQIPPLVVTAISIGIGSVLLLGAGLALEGLPVLPLAAWGIVAWLAVVNTAFAFTLWNKTLQTLSAMESSIINGTMMIQIAILAWVFLNESLTGQAVVGLVASGLGAVLVQLRLKPAGRMEVERQPVQERPHEG